MNLKLNRVRLAFAACVLTLATAVGAQAYGLWYPLGNDIIPVWKPYSQNQANWQMWAMTQPADKHPILDTTGAFCGQGQSTAKGSIWFLAGTFDGSPVTRSCTIPADRSVMFPVLNEAWFAFPEDDNTESVVRAQNVLTAQASGMSVTIDGITLPITKLSLTESTLFHFNTPADSLFGALTISAAADKGYYVNVKLLPGTHKLSWKGTMPSGTPGVNYSQDVTYNITVK